MKAFPLLVITLVAQVARGMLASCEAPLKPKTVAVCPVKKRGIQLVPAQEVSARLSISFRPAVSGVGRLGTVLLEALLIHRWAPWLLLKLPILTTQMQ